MQEPIKAMVAEQERILTEIDENWDALQSLIASNMPLTVRHVIERIVKGQWNV